MLKITESELIKFADQELPKNVTNGHIVQTLVDLGVRKVVPPDEKDCFQGYVVELARAFVNGLFDAYQTGGSLALVQGIKLNLNKEIKAGSINCLNQKSCILL